MSGLGSDGGLPTKRNSILVGAVMAFEMSGANSSICGEPGWLTLRGFIIPPASTDALASASVTNTKGCAQESVVVKPSHKATEIIFLNGFMAESRFLLGD